VVFLDCTHLGSTCHCCQLIIGHFKLRLHIYDRLAILKCKVPFIVILLIVNCSIGIHYIHHVVIEIVLVCCGWLLLLIDFHSPPRGVIYLLIDMVSATSVRSSFGSYGGSLVINAYSASKSIINALFVSVIRIGYKSPNIETDTLLDSFILSLLSRGSELSAMVERSTTLSTNVLRNKPCRRVVCLLYTWLVCWYD